MSMFSPAQIKAAIERCNLDCIAAIERNEAPEVIEKKRSGIETLERWLRKAEEAERHGQVAERDGGGRQPGRAV